MDQNQTNLPYKIAFVSSEDPEYPASELLSTSNESRGWHTQRYCVYPQTLVLQFMSPSKINKFQFLSHQCKISTKIEVHIAMTDQNHHPLSLDELHFQKIGYFSLSSNERNNYQARELKTVFIDAPASFIKFEFQQPYPNSMNLFSQVGVIGISFQGQSLIQQQFSSNEQKQFDLETKVNFDQKTLALLQHLEQQKRIAVDEENFQEAKRIVEKIKSLKGIAQQLKILEERKQIAITNDDFDAAIIIKEEIKALKRQCQVEDEEDLQQQYYENMHPSYINQQSQMYDPMQNYQTPQKNYQEMISNSVMQNKSKIVNDDDRPIPTLIDKNQEVDMMKESQPQFNEIQAEQREPPKLDKKSMDKVHLFSEYFEKDFLLFSFSPNWKDKNDQCEQLIEFYQNVQKGSMDLPNEFTHLNDLNKLFIGCWDLNNEFLDNKIPKLLSNAFKLLEFLIKTKNKYREQIILNQHEWGKSLDVTLMHLMNLSKDYKIERQITRISDILVDMIELKIAKIDNIILLISKKQGLPKKYQSNNHMIGRLQICIQLGRSIPDKFNINLWHDLLQFSIENYEKPQKEVRDLAHDLILIIYQAIGEDETMRFLEESELRPLHKNTLEKEFQEMKQTNDPKFQSIVFNEQQENENPENQNIDNEDSDSDSEVNQDYCQFCRRQNDNFRYEDQFNMHLWKECPMLITCHYCNQVIEIKEYVDHLKKDCSSKKLLQVCSKCNFPIDKELISEHQQTQECRVYDPYSITCPLCKKTLVDQGKKNKSWRYHLLEDGCLNNPRTNQYQ